MLTDDQTRELRAQAIETVFVRAQEDWDYLRYVVTQWIETYGDDGVTLANIIDADERRWPERIPFDPRTGQRWTERRST